MSKTSDNIFHAINFLQLQGISQATEENFYALQILDQRITKLYEAMSHVVTVDDTKAAIELRDGLKKIFSNAAQVPLDELTVFTKDHYKSVNAELASMNGVNEALKKERSHHKFEKVVSAVVGFGAVASIEALRSSIGPGIPILVGFACAANAWWSDRKLKKLNGEKPFSEEDFKEVRDKRFMGFLNNLVTRYDLKPNSIEP